MSIEITGCSRPRMWYAGLVGSVVTCVRKDASGYWAREPSGYLNVVLSADAKEIPCEPS